MDTLSSHVIRVYVEYPSGEAWLLHPIHLLPSELSLHLILFFLQMCYFLQTCLKTISFPFNTIRKLIQVGRLFFLFVGKTFMSGLKQQKYQFQKYLIWLFQWYCKVLECIHGGLSFSVCHLSFWATTSTGCYSFTSCLERCGALTRSMWSHVYGVYLLDPERTSGLTWVLKQINSLLLTVHYYNAWLSVFDLCVILTA